MSDPDGDTADAGAAALAVVAALRAARMSCAIGGSLALAAWGVPRGTKDADINVFVGPERHGDLLEALVGLGLGPAPGRVEWTAEDRERFLRRCREGDVAVAFRGSTRVDLFVPSIPFYEHAERTVHELPLPGGGSTPVLSAEALCVFKLLFFRDKDLVDLRRLVARQGLSLDTAWIRARMVEMFPDGDARLDGWDALLREVSAPPL